VDTTPGDATPRVIPPRLLYSPVEAQQLLGISHASLYRLLRAGRLTAVKIGTMRRITAASIESLAAAPAAVGASRQPEPPTSDAMRPEADGRGARLRGGRSRSVHESARVTSSG
jgi:excisionase family DNA binding protein